MYFILYISNPLSITKYNDSNRTHQIIQSFRVATLYYFQVINRQKMHIIDILEHGKCSVLSFPHKYHNYNENLRIFFFSNLTIYRIVKRPLIKSLYSTVFLGRLVLRNKTLISNIKISIKKIHIKTEAKAV